MDESTLKRHERLQELQLSNIDSWCGRLPRLDAKALDSNMKKNTGFIKKCKTSMGQDSASQLLREVKLLKLEKYVSEIVPAAAEGLLKCKAAGDIAAAVDIMSALHARFPVQFTSPLISLLLKSLAPPAVAALVAMTPEMREREEQVRLVRQKIILRVVTEMYLSGLLWGVDSLPSGVDGLDRAAAFMIAHPLSAGSSAGAGSANKFAGKVKEVVQQPGYCVMVGVLQNLLLSDKEHHLSTLLAVAFARSFKAEFALASDEALDASACAVPFDSDNLGDGREPVVTADICKKIRTLLGDYLDSAIAHLYTMHKTLLRMRRNTEEKLFNRGVVHAEMKEKMEKNTKSFDKLRESVTMLCEPLGVTPPDFSESADGENQLGIVFDGPTVVGATKPNQRGLWEDEDERTFYEVVLDLQSQLPPALLASGRKKAKDDGEQLASPDQAAAPKEDDASGSGSASPGVLPGVESNEVAEFEDIDEGAISLDIQPVTAEFDEFGDEDAGEPLSALGQLEYQKFISQRRQAEGTAESGPAGGELTDTATTKNRGMDDMSRPPPVTPLVSAPAAGGDKDIKGKGKGSASETTVEEDGEAESTMTIVQQSGPTRSVTQTIASRSFSEVLRRLPTFVTKEDVDQTAIDFCYVNNRANRATLIRALVDVPRRQLYIIPYYARLTSVLNPYFSEIGESVVSEISHEFCWLVKQRFKDLMETRLKNIKYIAELTKFKVAPLHIAYRCAKVLIEEFNTQNVEVLCALLDGCGRFLLAQADTVDRVTALLDILMRKRCVLNLDDRTILLIENACNACRPQLTQRVQHVKFRTPYEQFIRKLIYEDLARESADRVCLKLRKLPWVSLADGDDPQRVRHALISCFTKVWKVKYANVYLVTMVAGVLGRAYPWFRVAIVDTVMDNIKLGLERNLFARNQRRMAEMRYVGEMFIYKLISGKEVIDLLYLLLRLGHSEAHPVPGRGCDLDMPAEYFRARLVSTLLLTCGQYIRNPEDRRALETFAVYFQLYVLAKEQPLPIDTEYSVDHMYETVFPAVKRYETWPEAAQAMSELIKGKAPVAESTDSKARQNQTAALSHPDGVSAADTAASVGGVQDSCSGIGGPASDNENGDNNDGENDNAYGEDNNEDEELILQQRKEAEEAEMAEARLQMEAMEALLEQEEEEILEHEFNRLVVESSDTRKIERSAKLDVGIPMNLLGRSSATQMATSNADIPSQSPAENGIGEASPATAGEPAESVGAGEFNAIKFSLLTGKRHRPVVREVNIPVESQIARNLRQQEESAMRERAHLKRIVLNYERREEAEERRNLERELAISRARPLGTAAAAAQTIASRFTNVYRRPIVPGATFVNKPSSAASRRRQHAASQEQQKEQQQRANIHPRIPDHFL
ncbi:mRNA decay protein [Kickxella alabastrina]|uniref:mRNA decay protein n=1 Tax=Kickxella alabastrina TaxID=61397 RepID=A0ACC1IJ64_9FUNG|nr:mRNA decay protein [Kickxella alabastrina]